MSVLVLGSLYIPKYNGIAWTQPGGVGTQVLPTLGDGPFTNYPVPGQFYAPSQQALWRPGCGHGIDTWKVFRDFDSTSGKSVAVVCCCICTFIQQLIEPYELWTDPLSYPIIVG